MPILKTVTDARGHTIATLRQKFPVDADDTDWMGTLGQEGGWVAITKDPRICRSPHERAKWIDSHLTAFFLDGPGWGNLKLWDFSWRLIKWWPIIVEMSETALPGKGFIVPASHSARIKTVAVKKSEMAWLVAAGSKVAAK